MNAYLLGKENMDFGKQVIYGKNAQQQDIPIDVSNETNIPNHPNIQEVNDRGELLVPDIAPGDPANGERPRGRRTEIGAAERCVGAFSTEPRSTYPVCAIAPCAGTPLGTPVPAGSQR